MGEPLTPSSTTAALCLPVPSLRGASLDIDAAMHTLCDKCHVELARPELTKLRELLAERERRLPT